MMRAVTLSRAFCFWHPAVFILVFVLVCVCGRVYLGMCLDGSFLACVCVCVSLCVCVVLMCILVVALMCILVCVLVCVLVCILMCILVGALMCILVCVLLCSLTCGQGSLMPQVLGLDQLLSQEEDGSLDHRHLVSQVQL